MKVFTGGQHLGVRGLWGHLLHTVIFLVSCCSMASQGSTVYSLEALDKELVDITPYSIQTFSAKLKDCLEVTKLML